MSELEDRIADIRGDLDRIEKGNRVLWLPMVAVVQTGLVVVLWFPEVAVALGFAALIGVLLWRILILVNRIVGGGQETP
jgi:hypothetical protein